LFVAQSALFGA
jgi:hypothetical protein